MHGVFFHRSPLKAGSPRPSVDVSVVARAGRGSIEPLDGIRGCGTMDGSMPVVVAGTRWESAANDRSWVPEGVRSCQKRDRSITVPGRDFFSCVFTVPADAQRARMRFSSKCSRNDAVHLEPRMLCRIESACRGGLL